MRKCSVRTASRNDYIPLKQIWADVSGINDIQGGNLIFRFPPCIFHSCSVPQISQFEGKSNVFVLQKVLDSAYYEKYNGL